MTLGSFSQDKERCAAPGCFQKFQNPLCLGNNKIIDSIDVWSVVVICECAVIPGLDIERKDVFQLYFPF